MYTLMVVPILGVSVFAALYYVLVLASGVFDVGRRHTSVVRFLPFWKILQVPWSRKKMCSAFSHMFIEVN